jgi:hypothetical protein
MAAQHLGGDRMERAEPGHPFHRRADQGPTRSRISRAALLVKVTHRIWDG